MFKRIQIDRFRSCENVVLDNLGPMTALVGPNGAGKTNILKAIEWLARTTTQNVALTSVYALAPLQMECEISIDRCIYHYAIRFESNEAAHPNPEWLLAESLSVVTTSGTHRAIFERTGNTVHNQLSGESLQLGTNSPAMPALDAILPSSAPLLVHIRPVMQFLRSIRYYLLDEDTEDLDHRLGLVRTSDYESWLADREVSGLPSNSVLTGLLHLYLAETERFEELTSLLGPHGLAVLDGITVRETAVGETPQSKFYSFWFKPNVDSEQITFFDGLSYGTRRILRLITALLLDRSSVMLLEHPEDGIHRGLLRKVISLLETYSADCQFILSSHSSVVLDSLTPLQTRLVAMRHGETLVRGLTDIELAAAKSFLDAEGPFSDFLETVQDEG